MIFGVLRTAVQLPLRPEAGLEENPPVPPVRPLSPHRRMPLRCGQHLVIPALLSAWLIGCGDDPPPAPPPPPPPAPTAPATTPPKPTQPSASASSSASSAAPIASFSPAAGPVRWADFGGPEVEPTVRAGDLAWAVLPVSVGWETLKFAVLPVSKIEGNVAVFEVASGDTKTQAFVPGAFTSPLAPPDKLAPDDAVMIATGGARAFGRVVTAPADKKVKVRYRFAGSFEEKEVDLTEVLKLDGTLKFGAPVAFSEEKDEGTKRRVLWHPASLVHSAEDKAWVVSFGRPIRVPLATVKPMSVATLHRPGDKVWAASSEELLPGQIAEVQDNGTRYKVKLDEGGTEVTASFENVTPPLK